VPDLDYATALKMIESDLHEAYRLGTPLSEIFPGLPVSSWRRLFLLVGFGEGGPEVPDWRMVDFLAAILKTTPRATLLDPCAGTGFLLAALTEASGAASCCGITDQPNLALAQQLVPAAVWHVGRHLTELRKLQDQQLRFELIGSAPPWAVGPLAYSRWRKSDRPISKLPFDHQLVLLSTQLLDKTGRAFFVLPNEFLLNTESGARALLETRGFHIWSIIALPRAWRRSIFTGENVIEIRPQPVDEIFVAKASDDSPNNALVANLLARQRGKVPELGSLVATQDFSTLEAYENDLAFEAAARSFGGSVKELSSFVIAKSFGSRTTAGGFEDYPNVVYVPISATRPAVTSHAALGFLGDQYIQLVLDPALADAEYVATFLNTPLGILARQAVYLRAVNREASLATVDLARIVLPSLVEQIQRVRLQRQVDGFKAKLDATERDLWRSEDGYHTARHALHTFHEGDSLEAWFPRLPYPLSSILWNYQATLDVRRQVEILFAFFEATAEFLTTIFLSGLRSDPAIYAELKTKSLSRIESANWRQATIGFWILTGTKLAQAARHMLKGKQRPLCLDVFRCTGSWLDAMASNELFTVIAHVGELRNAWQGHGGIESDSEAEQRLDRLRSELTAVFTPLTTAFEDLTLIRPKTMKFDGQLYDVVAEELVGHAVPFRETAWQAIRPLKTGALFLLERHGRDGLELLPFVRMRVGTPATTACYFYSRLATGGARFVSYHQAQDSEVVEEDLALVALVNDLTGSGS
jgi:hypothetical protein